MRVTPARSRCSRALVAWGTRQGTDTLDAIAADETLDPLTALHRLAAQLLALMLQPKKLALFRIAVAEGNRLSRSAAPTAASPGIMAWRVFARSWRGW